MALARKPKTLLKVIVLGDVGVGKTSLIKQFVNNKFSSQYKTTIGADFFSKKLQIDGHAASLQIWDTAGQERFHSLGASFFRGADCCVLVYDVTHQKSFEALKYWFDEFVKQADIPEPLNFPFIVIGNKIDVEEGEGRVVIEKRAREWCSAVGADEEGLPYFETSAKENVNVEAAFLAAAKAALQHEGVQDVYYENMPGSISDLERGGCAC